MKRFISALLNIIFFSVIIILSIAVATIALTNKVNEHKSQANTKIRGTVIKQAVPVLSLSDGIVKKLYFRQGQEIKKGSLMISIDNPALVTRIETLSKFKNNTSAQTEAELAKEQLQYLSIYSPVNGIIAQVYTSDGAPIESLSRVATIYSNDDIKLLTNLNIEEYQTIKQLRELSAYSRRLSSSFIIQVSTLRPDVTEEQLSNSPEYKEKKLGLYFKFKNNAEAKSLLHNEDLELQIYEKETKIKPIDIFVNFWNNILLPDKKQTP